MQKYSLKIIWFISFFLICINAMSEPVEKMLPHNKLIVAVPNINHSIYFHKNDKSEWEGLDIDLARNIAKTLRVPLEFNFSGSSFDDVVQLVAEHKADIALGNLSITLDRAQSVLYTDSYVELHEAFLFSRLWLLKHEKKDGHFPELINNPELRLGTIEGSSYFHKAQQVFARAKLFGYPSFDAVYQALVNRKIDAIYLDDFLSEQYLLNNSQMALFYKVIVMTDEKDLIAIAVAHDNVRLQHWLNQYLGLKHINYSAVSLLKISAQQQNAANASKKANTMPSQ